MTDAAQESVLEMELSPETAKYRQNRLLWWTNIRAGYDDYVADALKHGATQAAAEAAASKHQSSEARALLSELLYKRAETALAHNDKVTARDLKAHATTLTPVLGPSHAVMKAFRNLKT